MQYTLYQRSFFLWCCVSSQKNIWIWNWDVEAGVVHCPSLPVTYSVTLLGSTGLAVPVVDVAVFSPEDTARVHLNCRRWLLSGHLEHLVTRDQKVRKVTILAGITNSSGQWEIRLVAQKGNQEAYMWSSDDPLGCSLVPDSPLIIITVNRQVKQLQPEKDMSRG